MGERSNANIMEPPPSTDTIAGGSGSPKRHQQAKNKTDRDIEEEPWTIVLGQRRSPTEPPKRGPQPTQTTTNGTMERPGSMADLIAGTKQAGIECHKGEQPGSTAPLKKPTRPTYNQIRL